MKRDVRGIVGCVVVPLLAAVAGAGVLAVVEKGGVLIDAFFSARFTRLRWAVEEIREISIGVMVFFYPVLLITYLVYHFMLRRHLVGRFERPARVMALKGGGLLVLGYLVVMMIIGVTCWDDGWVNLDFFEGFASSPADGGGLWVIVGMFLGSALTLGWWAGAFLPVHHDSEPTSEPKAAVGRRMVVAGSLLGVLLISLGSPVFFHWMKGSNRAGCIMNIRNAQQAMRSYHGMYNAHRVTKEMLVGPNLFIETEPVCPRGGSYTWGQGPVPPVGELMLHCSCEGHAPDSTSGW